MAMSAPATDLVSPTISGTRSALLARAADYVALTRPRILLLVLFTVPPAFVLGGGHWPSPFVLLGVMLGVALLGAGSSALNAWWERDRDARMARTASRPLPQQRLAPRQALAFGVATSALGTLLLAAGGGALAVALGLLTLAHYLLVYTVWLKPRSAWSTVVGALAGAAPPLIADSVDGVIGPWGLLLFAIVFLWQPPHVWTIAFYRGDEYAAAGFPMLPRVAGAQTARRWMLAFAVALWGVMLLPWLAGELGAVYGTTALRAGGFFGARIARAMRRDTPAADRASFRASLLTLSTVLAVMLAECVLR
jgi:protoheme IX farnesyltransferase